jgi:hypothetical protein
MPKVVPFQVRGIVVFENGDPPLDMYAMTAQSPTVFCGALASHAPG